MTNPETLDALTDPKIKRTEWERRYASQLMNVGAVHEMPAIQMAKAAADENLRNNGDEWLDPEDDADVEMSYWEE